MDSNHQLPRYKLGALPLSYRPANKLANLFSPAKLSKYKPKVNPMIQQFEVNDTQVGERLDVFLSEVLELPRGKTQKLIKSSSVRVGDEVGKPGYKVKEGDLIEVRNEIAIESSIEKTGPGFNVLHEDDDVLVIDKPAGLLVHRANAEDTSWTLVDALLKRNPEIAGVGDAPEERPGIVHRLDKTASGVMVVAKNQAAFDHLKRQFVDRLAKKEYTALVYGQMEQAAGEINFRIGRSKRSGKMVALPEESKEGREAITLYDVIQEYSTTSLLKVQIKTGRTHQIRAHMQAIDHPIVGDPLYKKKQMKNINPIELDRIFLHAAKLTIELPCGETKTFEAPLPDELQEVLTNL